MPSGPFSDYIVGSPTSLIGSSVEVSAQVNLVARSIRMGVIVTVIVTVMAT